VNIMLGFVVGSVSLITLLKLCHMRRMARAYHMGQEHGPGMHHGGPFGGPFGGRGPFGGGPFGGGPFGHGRSGHHGPFRGGRRRGLYGLFEALDATPAQEKVILSAIDEVKLAVREGRGEIRQSREDLARAFRADSFDAEVMGNAFARHDEHIERLRKAVTGALARVHDALDDKQRAQLAEWLDSRGGMGAFMGGFGPYR
jgi:Spy/CpxP family protein refolding chaperone